MILVLKKKYYIDMIAYNPLQSSNNVGERMIRYSQPGEGWLLKYGVPGGFNISA